MTIGLRELRLWHWRQMGRARRRALDKLNTDPKSALGKALNKEANWHLGAVQRLNEFFPIGDTAEADDVEARKIGK